MRKFVAILLFFIFIIPAFADVKWLYKNELVKRHGTLAQAGAICDTFEEVRQVTNIPDLELENPSRLETLTDDATQDFYEVVFYSSYYLVYEFIKDTHICKVYLISK